MTTYPTHDTPAQSDDIDARFPPGHPVHKAVQRVVSDTYSFWALCESGKCRRAGRCRGEPTRCLDAFMPLLSPAVGAVLMSLSTIIVAANAQLLRREHL